MTKIPWTEKSWNPVVGCTKIAVGCKNCYAERMACRLACINPLGDYTETVSWKPMPGHWTGRVVCRENVLEQPLHWRKPRKVFVCSMGDLFHEKVPFEFIAEVENVIRNCPQHTFQVLTKRPKAMYYYWKWMENHWPPEKLIIPNLWLGTSISTQADLDRVWQTMRDIPAAIKFYSYEPALERIDFDRPSLGYIVSALEAVDWVIIGCESGPKARLCSIDDIRDAVRQCREANVPVFVKQIPVNGKCNKNPYDGPKNRWPEDLRIQEYPK